MWRTVTAPRNLLRIYESQESQSKTRSRERRARSEEGPDLEIYRAPLPAFQCRRARRCGERLRDPPAGRRQNASHTGRGDVDGRARHFARRDDPPGQGPRDRLHGGEPGGGYLQSRRARLLRARAALPPPDSGGRSGAGEAPHEPRDRHVHSRDGSDAPDRGGGRRRVDEGRPGGRAVFPARVHV